MFVLGIPAAFAVAALHHGVPLDSMTEQPRDRAALAPLIHGTSIDMWHRTAALTITAQARETGSGCATRISTKSSDAATTWSRDLRWNDVAWTGALSDGRVMVAFYEQDGRLPGDRVAFAPADATAFQAALRQVSETCRLSSAEGERILTGAYPTSRSCYFARYPGLELVEPVGAIAATDPTRAVITMLAQETPEAELRVLVDNGAEKGAPRGGNAWARPDIAFTVAGLNHHKITTVRFAFDGQPVAAGHSIALYGDTRLRVRMDPSASGQDEAASFYHRLSGARRATVTLADAAGVARAVLTFEPGPALAAARRAVDNAAWSCTTATSAPTPASPWQIAP